MRPPTEISTGPSRTIWRGNPRPDRAPRPLPRRTRPPPPGIGRDATIQPADNAGPARQSPFAVPNLAAQPLFSQAFEAGTLEPKLDLQALIDKILDQVNLVKSRGKTELSLNLKQEELGDIFLQLTSLSGKVSIFLSASAEAKKLIDAHKDELERALKKAHVNFGTVTIEEVKKPC